jgi:hypothetical protein
MAQDAILHHCPICSRPVATAGELEDHIVETHPDDAPPDVQDTYKARHQGTASDQGDTSIGP